GERTSERSEDGGNLSWPRTINHRRGRPDAVAEDRDARGRPVVAAQDLEHRKRPAEQRIETGADLDHHELAGLGGGGDGGSGKPEDVVVGRKSAVGEDLRRDVDWHRGSLWHYGM